MPVIPVLLQWTCWTATSWANALLSPAWRTGQTRGAGEPVWQQLHLCPCGDGHFYPFCFDFWPLTQFISLRQMRTSRRSRATLMVTVSSLYLSAFSFSFQRQLFKLSSDYLLYKWESAGTHLFLNPRPAAFVTPSPSSPFMKKSNHSQAQSGHEGGAWHWNRVWFWNLEGCSRGQGL